MINNIIIFCLVVLYPNIYSSQEDEIINLVVRRQGELIRIVSCDTQLLSEKDLCRVIAEFRDELEDSFNIQGLGFNRELNKLFHLELLSSESGFGEVEPVFFALLRNKNVYKKKIFLYELLKFGFLSEFGSDFIECRECALCLHRLPASRP